MNRGAAASTWPVATAAAEAALGAGRSAVDALIAGFFAAAGEGPGVLLAPAIALVAGGGAGARAFDGRSAQPGRAAPRPRGALPDEAIADAARVSAPRTVPMLMLLHARHGRAPLRELVRPGGDAAAAAGQAGRAELLRRIGGGGAAALHGDAVARSALSVAGPASGGALTSEDWTSVACDDAPAPELVLEAGRIVSVPAAWQARAEGDASTPGAAGASAAIVACDGRGLVAALAIEPIASGIELPDARVYLPTSAEPVRRGVTRMAPGAAIPLVAPLALAVAAGGFASALAVVGGSLDGVDLTALVGGVAVETTIAAIAAQAGGRALAVAADARGARRITPQG